MYSRGNLLSAESHLSLLERVVRSAEKLCVGELCCEGHRRRICALCLLYEIYYTADHPLHEQVHHFVTACDTRASAALGELALVILRCKSNQ